MEQREFFNETKYIEGFNLGYRITKEFPELAEILDSAKGNSDKLEGMKDGKQQYLEEILKKEHQVDLIKESRPKWLSEDRLNENHKANDIDKDIEPEK